MDNKNLKNRKLRGTGGTPFYPNTQWSAIVDAPSFEGQSGKFLTTDGNALSFNNIDLSQLSDVYLSNLTEGQSLKYNSVTQKWENAEVGADDFICNITMTEESGENPTVSCDKSVREIIDAYDNGKNVYAKWNYVSGLRFLFPLTTIYDDNGYRVVYFANNIYIVFGAGILYFAGIEQNNTDTWQYDTLLSSSDIDKLNTIESGAQQNVQSDWNENDSSSDAYIRNKPNINANIQYGTTAYWNSRTGYVPPEGAIIIYSDYHSEIVDGQTVYYPGIKIGDNNAYVQDIVFLNEDESDKLLAHLQDNTRHITALERTFWNDKLNVDDDQEVIDETLILNRN